MESTIWWCVINWRSTYSFMKKCLWLLIMRISKLQKKVSNCCCICLPLKFQRRNCLSLWNFRKSRILKIIIIWLRLSMNLIVINCIFQNNFRFQRVKEFSSLLSRKMIQLFFSWWPVITPISINRLWNLNHLSFVSKYWETS